MDLKWHHIVIMSIIPIIMILAIVNNKYMLMFLKAPQITSTEYFEDDSASISRTSVIKGVCKVYVYTECGEVYIDDSSYYHKYYEKDGTPVIAKIKKDYYNDGMVHLTLYAIEDIKKEGD